MDIKVIDSGDDILHVVLAGKLDAVGVEEQGCEFAEVVQNAGKPTVVDIADVDFLSSLGMGMLLDAANHLKAKGLKMVMLNPQHFVTDALQTVKLQLVIPLTHSLDESREVLAS